LPAQRPQQPKKELEEKPITRVFNYLNEHRDTSLSEISENTQLPTKTVKKIIEELKRQNKIRLLP
jgi:DNA-binding IclR family transcriptional regulator